MSFPGFGRDYQRPCNRPGRPARQRSYRDGGRIGRAVYGHYGQPGHLCPRESPISVDLRGRCHQVGDCIRTPDGLHRHVFGRSACVRQSLGRRFPANRRVSCRFRRRGRVHQWCEDRRRRKRGDGRLGLRRPHVHLYRSRAWLQLSGDHHQRQALLQRSVWSLG